VTGISVGSTARVVPSAAGPELTVQYVLSRTGLARPAAGFAAGPVTLWTAPQSAMVIAAASIA